MPIEALSGERVEFLGLHFDRLDLAGALAWLGNRSATSPFGYVVTPNVDHILRIESDPRLLRLYKGAALCVNDSRVLQRLAGRAGVRLGLAPGSDLTPALLDRIAQAGDRVAIVGGDPDTAAALETRHPQLSLLQCHPPMKLAGDERARRAVIDWMIAHPARFFLLAVGSPQQEMLAAEAAATGAIAGTALCIGASLDFVTGAKLRAPRIIQRLSLEWAWRLASEPQRLGRRYLVDAPRIFPLVSRWRRDRARQSGSSRP